MYVSPSTWDPGSEQGGAANRAKVRTANRQAAGRAANNCTGNWTYGGFSGFRWEGAVSGSYRRGTSTNSSDLGSGRRPEPIGMKKREAPHVVFARNSVGALKQALAAATHARTRSVHT